MRDSEKEPTSGDAIHLIGHIISDGAKPEVRMRAIRKYEKVKKTAAEATDSRHPSRVMLTEINGWVKADKFDDIVNEVKSKIGMTDQ